MSKIDWYNITFSAGISTAFQTYDAQPEFVTASEKVVRYVVRSLGYPITDVELSPQHIFTSFQSATMKYNTIVNQAKIADNMLNVFGTDPDIDLSTSAIYDNLNGVFQISSLYAQQSQIRQSLNVEIRQATIDIQGGVQKYDLRDFIPQYTSSNIEFVQIYYYPMMYRSNAFDPIVNPGFNMASIMHEFGGVYSQNAKLVMMPVFETLLKMQSLQLSQNIRRSHIGFQIRKNHIIFMPTPPHDTQIAVQYILKSDKYANSVKQNGVDTIANFPISNYMPYAKINVPGKNWIQRYTLALAKQVLGIIRSKYSSIPYPQGQTSLDGQTLRTEAKEEQDNLVQELKLVLEQTSMHKLLQKKSQMAQNLQLINSKVPLRIFIG